MKWWEVIIHLFGIAFAYFAYLKSYTLLFNVKTKKIKFLSILIILVILFLTYYNSFYNYNYMKIIISFFLLTIVFKLSIDDEYSKIVLKGIILYILGMVLEIMVGTLTIVLGIESIMQFDKFVIMKVLFSIFIMLLTMLLASLNPVKKVITKIYKSISNRKIIIFLLILLCFLVILLTGNMVKKLDFLPYISQYLIIIIISIFFLVLLKQIIQINKSIEKEQILLEFIEKYEKLVDDNRINKHEIVNNLLVLKSIKNKNTKEYEKILQELITKYETNDILKGIYNLPHGLKGIIYYRLHDVEKLNINVIINVSSKSIKKIEKLNTLTFSKLCKIIGILLQNAKEAANNAKYKEIIIDIYENQLNTEIYIENTYSGIVNINKIASKNYSTKGKGRGLGLYIIQEMLFGNKTINFIQKIQNNRFVSILTIKTN